MTNTILSDSTVLFNFKYYLDFISVALKIKEM